MLTEAKISPSSAVHVMVPPAASKSDVMQAHVGFSPHDAGSGSHWNVLADGPQVFRQYCVDGLQEPVPHGAVASPAETLASASAGAPESADGDPESPESACGDPESSADGPPASAGPTERVAPHPRSRNSSADLVGVNIGIHAARGGSGGGGTSPLRCRW